MVGRFCSALMTLKVSIIAMTATPATPYWTSLMASDALMRATIREARRDVGRHRRSSSTGQIEDRQDRQLAQRRVAVAQPRARPARRGPGRRGRDRGARERGLIEQP